jgi:hypothetical protein
MNSKLEEDLVLVSTEPNVRARKRKRRSKSSMMENFTSSTHKSKKTLHPPVDQINQILTTNSQMELHG